MEWEGRLKSTGDHWQSWDLSQLACLLDPFPIQLRTGKEGRPRGSRDPRDPSTTHNRAQGPGAQGQGLCRPTATSIRPPFLPFSISFPVPMERPVVIAKGPGPQ